MPPYCVAGTLAADAGWVKRHGGAMLRMDALARPNNQGASDVLITRVSPSFAPGVIPAKAGTQEVVQPGARSVGRSVFAAPEHWRPRAWIPAWSLDEGFALDRRGDDGDIWVIMKTDAFL